MTRRGRILRDTSTGAGLLVVDGTQFTFTLEDTWKSALPPSAGMAVDVGVEEGVVVSASAVPEGQLAKEQAEAALAAAKAKGSALAGAMVSRFGAPMLAATAALSVGWFFLSVGSVDSPLGKFDFTFWDVLGILNAGGAAAVMERMTGASRSAGIYGVVAIAAIAGPYAYAIWKDRRAHLAGLLPLVLMLFVAWKIFSLGPSADDASAAGALGPEGRDFVNAMTRQAAAELRKAISIGMGTYVAGAAAVWFAFVSARRFLAAPRTA